MYENAFGVPDALPSGYGYADAQPATVRLNASTSRGVPSMVHAPSNPTSHNPAALGQAMLQQTAVLRYSDLEQDADEDERYGAAAPAGKPLTDKDLTTKGKKPYIRLDEARGLKFRVIVVRGDGKIRSDAVPFARYRQYEDGSYAITYNPWPKFPSKVQLDIPFTAKENKGAYDSIKKQVESLVGPFPVGAAVNHPDQTGKKGKKAAKGKGKGKVDLTSALEVVGGAAKKFQDSGKATEPEESSAESESDTSTEDAEAWYARKYAGVPGWGWAAGVTVLTGVGMYFAFRKPKGAAPVPQAAAVAPVPSITAVPESE
jgi:hypothetical protein